MAMAGKSEAHSREVEIFTAWLTMLDFIDYDLPKIKTLGELRTRLVVWRKTHGWGKLSEEIGITEFMKLTGSDRGTVRRSVQQIPCRESCIKVESPKIDLESGAVLNLRKRFTFAVNDRVKAIQSRVKSKATDAESKQLSSTKKREPITPETTNCAANRRRSRSDHEL